METIVVTSLVQEEYSHARCLGIWNSCHFVSHPISITSHATSHVLFLILCYKYFYATGAHVKDNHVTEDLVDD